MLPQLELEEPKYDRRRVTLHGSQPLEVRLSFPADFIAFIDVSQVNPDKVYVAFNEPHVYLPLSKVIAARLPAPVVHRLLFTWEATEEGKTIEVYYAGAPGIEIGTRTVTIGGDFIGLARDATLSEVRDRLPSSLTSNGNFRVAILEDGVGLAKEATLSSIESRLTPAKIAETLQTLDNSGGSSTAAMDVFGSDIVVPDTGELAVQLALSADAKARLRIVRGGTTLEYYLNSGNALAANSWYEFVVTVLKDDAVNIVVEVPAGSTINAYAALILRRR